MSIVQRLSLTAAVLAVVASAALRRPRPAEAKNRSIYNTQQNWHLVDRNQDGADQQEGMEICRKTRL